MLKAVLLQTPYIELDGESVSFPFRRAEALLYYMLVQRSATRQELVSLLWEDCDEATGLKNLRNTLYSLKKTLGGEFLVSRQKSSVTVNETWEIDCDYDRLLKDHSLQAYQGRFLQGFSLKRAFAFEEWIRSEREKTREVYLRELMLKAEEAARQESREGSREAERLSREYLREEPFHEGMNCLLMRVLSAGGQYEKAAQVYQTLKKLLEKEMGILPQESTTALYYSIMNRWNEAAGSGSRPDSPALPAGRERILDTLRAVRESLCRGDLDRSACLLTGEAGSGKSELIRCFLGWTDLGDMYMAKTECLQSEERFPLLPWKRLVRQLFDMAAEEGLALPIRAQSILEEGFLKEGGPDGELRGTAGGPEKEESLKILLRELLRKKKILLVLENVQWLDPAGGNLLRHLLFSTELKGIMAVLSCRDDFDSGMRRLLTEMEKTGVLRNLKLMPLTEEETAFLIAREAGQKEAGELSGRFWRESGGNLVLLDKMIRGLKEGSGAEGPEPGFGPADEISMLPENALRILKLLSMFPWQISGSSLLELSGGDYRILTGGLEILRKKGLIDEYHGGSDDYYRVRYHRVREVVYEQTPGREKRAAYARMAELLEKNGRTGSAEEMRQTAQCFELALLPDRALLYRVRALSLECARAFVPFSWYGGETPLFPGREKARAEAERLFRALSERRTRGMDEAEAAQAESLLLEAAGAERVFGGDLKLGNELLGRISGMENPENRQIRPRICYLLAQLAVCRQKTDIAEHYVTAGMRSLPGSGDALQNAAFQRLRGACFCLRNSYEKAAYYHMEAIDILENLPRSAGVRLQLAAAYADLARVYRHKNEYAEASAAYKKALALGEEECWPGFTWICMHYGRTAFALEDHRKAREMFRNAVRISDRNGELPGRAASTAYLAWYAVEDGDDAAAAELLREAEESCGKLDSNLESGILSFVSMLIRAKEEKNGQRKEGLHLTESAEQYARQGLRRLEGIPDVFETELIRQALKNGLSGKTNYRASELYSRNRHFMTE